jgi:hypothetical protein
VKTSAVLASEKDRVRILDRMFFGKGAVEGM